MMKKLNGIYCLIGSERLHGKCRLFRWPMTTRIMCGFVGSLGSCIARKCAASTFSNGLRPMELLRRKTTFRIRMTINENVTEK